MLLAVEIRSCSARFLQQGLIQPLFRFLAFTGTDLLAAIDSGFHDIIASALRAGVSVETRGCDTDRQTLLHRAVLAKQAHIAELLLAHGVDPNATVVRSPSMIASARSLLRDHPKTPALGVLLRQEFECPMTTLEVAMG